MKAQPEPMRPLPALVGTQRSFLLLLLCYFAGHAVLRSILSPTANLDEAEQLMLTQEWALGYGPQPPLYTWLQSALFGVAGVSIASLAILKNALLFCTYALAYLNARLITGRHEMGVIASLSLFFIPQIAWESQRDLTHSVLASTLALATLYCFLKARMSGAVRWFALLGVALACGTMAKYNFLLWAVGLLAAAASLREFRGVALNWRMALALGIAALLVAPHAAWAIRNTGRATQTAGKFQIGGSPSAQSRMGDASGSSSNVVATRLVGTANMVWAITRFVGPLVAVHALLFWLRCKRRDAAGALRAEVGLMIRALAFIGVLLFLTVLISGATGFKDRWFQPILICAPVLLASWIEPASDPVFARRVWRLATVIMAVIAMLIPGKVLLAGLTGREERLNFPLPELGRTLSKDVDERVVVVADTPFIAGNLRLGMPQHRIISKSWGNARGQPRCLVWDARKNRRAPRDLFKAAGITPDPLETPSFLEAPLRRPKSRTYSLGVITPH